MRMHFIRVIFWLLAVVVCIYCVPYALRWEVGGVKVNTSGAHVGSDAVIATIEPHLQAGWLFSPLQLIQAELQALPWVEDADLYRAFPDRIVVNITERDPFARFKDSGLVSQKGVLFYPDDYAQWQDLPLLEVDSQDLPIAFQALRHIHQASPSEGLLPYGVYAVRFSPSVGWDVRFSNALLVRLGRGDFATLFERFWHNYPKILRYNANKVPHRIDMRYAHGAAIL